MHDFNLQPGGYVLSTGADLVDVERIRQAHERQQERFLNRIFTEAEQEYCFRMKNPYPHLAARFAAKEAISKAFTTGIGRWLGWKSMGIVHGERMEPLVELDDQARALLQRLGGSSVRISLSHTASQAFAVALLLK
ncbi:MAG: holo-ACP synthase [Opitutales bacterium]